MQLHQRFGSTLIGSAATALILIGLPLAGVALTGQDLAFYLEFPPRTRHVVHAGFSWTAFGILSAINLLILAVMGVTLKQAYQATRALKPIRRSPFPIWGWVGAGVMIGGWILAWHRFGWFAPLQAHTFCLPWIGYILLANALCARRSGRSPLTDHPKAFLLLFPAGAVFWWFFEYLNRFVQNWYYVGPMDLSPLAYTLFASLAFATVLPAVLSTYRLLLTFNTFAVGLKARPAMEPPHPKIMAATVLALSALGLLALGRFPDHLFALVWAAPVLIVISLQTLAGRATLFAFAAAGDWRPVITAAVSALICGFFWEMWNHGSLARWEYAIPFVDRFHIFAMPILGYGGYLPFGLECLVIIAWLMPNHLVFPWQKPFA